MKGKTVKRRVPSKRGDHPNPGMEAAEEALEHQAVAQVQKSFAARPAGGTGTLYLVATPIGNLEDMTFRAIRTLREADIIAAEDTRQTRKLLTHYEISGRLVSYHEHNKGASGPELIRLLEEGSSIALVSDAGIPAISDPGADLAASAASRGIPVVPIPGANAALSALIIAGLPTDRFLFAGFPPRDRKGMNPFLTQLEREPATLLFYEAPHRLKKTLALLAERWPNRRMAIVRELTKKHEEVVRGTVLACLAHVETHQPLGECCLVIEGMNSKTEAAIASDQDEASAWWSKLSLEQHVEHYEANANPDEEEVTRKDAMRLVARDRGVSRREIYQSLLNEEKSPS